MDPSWIGCLAGEGWAEQNESGDKKDQSGTHDAQGTREMGLRQRRQTSKSPEDNGIRPAPVPRRKSGGNLRSNRGRAERFAPCLLIDAFD
jgi:hypothetical protein